MIIQHPDGSQQICRLAPAPARWARGLLRRARAARAARTCAEASAGEACRAHPCGEGDACR